MFGRLGKVREGKIPPHREEREFAMKRFLLKCEVVSGLLLGILGVPIVMMNHIYVCISDKRGFTHKRLRLNWVL